MSNKNAVSKIYNITEELVNKSRSLTDEKRFNAMQDLIKKLDGIKEEFKILGYEDIWIEVEDQMKELSDEFGEVFIRLPLGFNRKGKVKYIDFTELFKK